MRVVWGACEALFTPRPLGPVYDIARTLKGSPRRHSDEPLRSVRGSSPHSWTSCEPHPTIAVFEDVHWADEATLDALKYLGRRIDAAPSLLVLTFRDDEVGSNHPLRQLLGDLAHAAITTRIVLQPLSVDAVEELARRAEQSSRGLYEADRGQPVLRHRGAGGRRGRRSRRRFATPCLPARID